MYPILLKIGNFSLYSYGLMLFISFILGIKLTQIRAKKFGIKEDTIVNLAVYILIGVVIGARFLYVLNHWDEFKNDLIGIIAFWRGGLGGLMFFGGFIGGFFSGLIYAKKNKLPILKMLDSISPAIALGEGFTRIGCFLNGCCFGKPCEYGIIFPPHSPAGLTFLNTKIHPTQLYSSLFGFLLFFFILKLEKTRIIKKEGLLFSIFLFFYALFRFLIDFLRYYEDKLNFLTNQLISFSLMIIALIIFLTRFKK
ncbi:MAG: prolipoprotein diacylglyceryl transferase [candidate division WOR-3 bacterium]|nr:prolipoprotein diacylglyceryl transferase [candidate division WOR-3 bacterium]MDW8114193.1 prolipoprotein diacylglyceryl transferase [candidate division WOR-3 bacterium]